MSYIRHHTSLIFRKWLGKSGNQWVYVQGTWLSVQWGNQPESCGSIWALRVGEKHVNQQVFVCESVLLIVFSLWLKCAAKTYGARVWRDIPCEHVWTQGPKSPDTAAHWPKFRWSVLLVRNYNVLSKLTFEQKYMETMHSSLQGPSQLNCAWVQGKDQLDHQKVPNPREAELIDTKRRHVPFYECSIYQFGVSI